MIPRDDPRAIGEAACAHIARVGGIPRSWLTFYVHYDYQAHEKLLRVDCMDVVFSTRYGAWMDEVQQAEKIVPELQDFIMLLWGEPCCHSN